MTTAHLTDEEIQLFAIDRENASIGVTDHMTECAICRMQAAAYKTVLVAVQQQEVPVFDFDLADLVVSQLRPVKEKKFTNSFSSALSWLLAFCLAGIPLFIFRQYFLNMLSGISVFSLLVSIVTCLLIIVFKVMNMYRKFLQQIKTLNFSE